MLHNFEITQYKRLSIFCDTNEYQTLTKIPFKNEVFTGFSKLSEGFRIFF